MTQQNTKRKKQNGKVLLRSHTTSTEATQALGGEIAKRLQPGIIVALFGDLGSGKTCLVQGICRGIGVKDRVTSPTFIMINEYKGHLEGSEIPIYHFDLYRLRDPIELYELGYEEYFYNDGICFIEWAERAEELLPEDALRVYLRYISDNERAVVVFDGTDQP